MQDRIKRYELLVLMLQIIAHNGNAMYVVESTNYKRFWKEMIFLKKLNFVEEKYGKLKLTSKGENLLEKLNNKLKRKGLYKYISPQYREMIDRINEDDLYIPMSTL
jgi:predicted transcriptional regulator